MRFSVRVRLSGDLLDIAKMVSVLERYHVTDVVVELRLRGEKPVMAVRGAIDTKRHPESLRLAARHLPGVLETTILDIWTVGFRNRRPYTS